MAEMSPHLNLKFFLLSVLLSSSFFNVIILAGETKNSDPLQNPFTAKASLIRYWNRKISNNLPKPMFLISKASPLTAFESAFFTKLVLQNNLSTHLSSFCSSANLVCFSDPIPSLEKHNKDVNFASYNQRNFTNYGTSQLGGLDSFKNYSENANIASDSFRRYSRDSVGHDDKFNTYQPDINVGDSSFNTYGAHTTGGSGDFSNYAESQNVPNFRFTSYESDGNGRDQSFSTYSDEANHGDESFTSYSKRGNGIKNDFSSYGRESNVIESGFTSYGESGNSVNDSFISYAFDTNNPQNHFNSYGDSGNAGTESFNSYREQANVGDDTFQSYGKNSNSAEVKFQNYGKSFNDGSDSFTGYGQKGTGSPSIGFETYGVKNTFQEYENKRSVSFAKYTNSSDSTNVKNSAKNTNSSHSSNVVNKWVEPGKFFREVMLKEGNVMPMPDIKDKMPKRSFLPQSISSKLPLSSSQILGLKQIFHASENSSMESILKNTIQECERAPSMGETKKCVSSMEDMIDFAVSVLGHNIVVRSTESVKGSNQDVVIGKVKGINGGKVTKSVSCHQSLFPYLVYYCHSVPKVRVYEADILDAKTNEKINHGTAICHVDTSTWSAAHGAFIALGSSPGKIEVCHWIFENDMTWAIAD